MNKAGILPFGYMPDNFNEALSGPPPTAWRTGAEPFDSWIERILVTIQDEAWPVWNPTLRKWEGRSVSTGIELSKADLDSMAVLSRHFREPSRQDKRDNNWWFWKEDDLFPQVTLKERFKEILGGGDDLNEKREATFASGGTARFNGSLSWILKDRLQRPRPHQMAHWLRLARPAFKLAWSAWSPSAICGHGYQGLMACLNVYLAEQWTPSQEKGLQELAADIGDRRVFAGVHFPSDNVLSWWVAFNAIGCLSADAGEKARMTDFTAAAVESSRVYQEMRSSARPGHASCLALLEPWLQEKAVT
jgi:hypothetical protein